MLPLEFLSEEFENVKRALRETLRYDFVPERSERYYTECKFRLSQVETAIAALSAPDVTKIAAQLGELQQLASWISLIERSHLGEFSWPFAAELDRLATSLLFETDMKGNKIGPIVHIISSGSGYRITYEAQVPSSSRSQRFVIVEFPRSLKHHVLLHAIFGHELCHTAIHTTLAGGLIHSAVRSALTSSGPFSSATGLTAWLNDAAAPIEVKRILAHIVASTGAPAHVSDDVWDNWLVELICDLFGLLLFGPGFLAAHRALLCPLHPMPYDLSGTHPPYAVRHRLLKRAMELNGWQVPVTAPADGTYFQAESLFLDYVLADSYSAWSTTFSDAQLTTAMAGIRQVFQLGLGAGYVPPTAPRVKTLMGRLGNGLPPHTARIDAAGQPLLENVDISHVLYAGWAYWVGRSALNPATPIGFFETNRLCDLALLQQQAINFSLSAGIP